MKGRFQIISQKIKFPGKVADNPNRKKYAPIHRIMRNPHLEYQRQAVMSASPIQLIVKMYDLAIQASYREDEQKLNDILKSLINGLNFEYEPAVQLFRLYEYCMSLAREGKFEEIRELLEPLREAWEQSANQNGAQASMTNNT